jgi:cell wall-associated NlpC family hydrolase
MSRFATSAKRPMNLSIAAGVAGTVAVTGTVVAVAADQPATPRVKPVTADPDNDLASTANLAALHSAVQQADVDQQQQLARERLARAKAQAKAKRERAAKAAARAAAARQSSAGASRSSARPDAPMTASGAHVLALAAAQSGDHYAYGAAGPDAFDCSGFTQYVFGKVGISLPHSSSGQSSMATPVSNPAPGDLVFVHNGGGGGIGHVAIYAGDGYWYEASNPGQLVGKHRAWSTNVSYGRVL